MNKNNSLEIFSPWISSFGRVAFAVITCLVMSAPLAADPYEYESLPGSSISDNACTDVSISVSDNFVVSYLNVGLNITHSYRGDLTVTLAAPDSTTAVLYSQHGGSGANLDLSLDDSHPALVASVGQRLTMLLPLFMKMRINRMTC